MTSERKRPLEWGGAPQAGAAKQQARRQSSEADRPASEDYFAELREPWGWRLVEPDDPCDRCGHRARAHQNRREILPDWSCRASLGWRLVERSSQREPAPCLCDGFVAVP